MEDGPMRWARCLGFALSLAVIAAPGRTTTAAESVEAEKAQVSDHGTTKHRRQMHIGGRNVRHHSGKRSPRRRHGGAEIGVASWYGHEWHGRRTASGERFRSEEMTAAHPTLPLHSRALVTNMANGKSVAVRITDRGPHTKGRIIDVSHSAAERLGMLTTGVARVKVEPLPRVEAAKAPSAASGADAKGADAPSE
jgi:rare lipoprotein A